MFSSGLLTRVCFEMGRDGQVEILAPQTHRSWRSAESKERDSRAGKQQKWTNAQQHDQTSETGGDLGLGW
jgi:hypothetical protein